MSLSSITANQLRHPTGFLGKLFGKLMNKGNSDLNNYMKELLDIQPDDHIIEIGFGNGKLIYEMSQIATHGSVSGIDYSETMLRQACKKNRLFIKTGRVKLKNASIDKIPFQDDEFNKVCTANTIYFWPNPHEDIKEIYRVLKIEGKLVIGFRTKEQLERLPFVKHGFTKFTEEDIHNLLEKTGFRNINILLKEHHEIDSYCAIAIK